MKDIITWKLRSDMVVLMAKHYPFSIDEIDITFQRLNSIDYTFRAMESAIKENRSLKEISNRMLKELREGQYVPGDN